MDYENIEGKYFGTEIDGKWWKRFRKDKMLARGNGILSYDEQSISFLRRLTTKPITIQYSDILEIKLGSWHAGQWAAGRKIFKIVWKKENMILSSGFSILKSQQETIEIISILKRRLKIA